MHREFDSTPWLLENWATWARVQHGLHLNYPNMATFRRLLGNPGARSPAISDLCASAVDQAVASLCARDEALGDVLVRAYLLRWPVYRIAEKHRQGRRWATAQLRAAEQAVSELLDGEG